MNRENKQPLVANASILSKIVVYLSFILIIPLIIFLIARNNLLRLQQAIAQTESDIDVQLKKRYDLLTKLVDSTKVYLKFEQATLTVIVRLRNDKDYSKANQMLNEAYSKFNVVLENYPNLKANESVQQLQNAAVDCEENIAAARRFYNANVQVFNSKLITFPSNVVASNLQLMEKSYFSATIKDRNVTKVAFDI